MALERTSIETYGYACFTFGMLVSMAMRYDHGFPLCGSKRQFELIGEALKAYHAGDKQICEEVAGTGFYRLEAEHTYRNLINREEESDYDRTIKQLIDGKRV